ncbi:MAG: ATP-binding cassette domain-containing protein [Muribaculaceae bacterium]|nr:ATP-binding cassette domain-containing protein [Muribaculaceae bacterium]
MSEIRLVQTLPRVFAGMEHEQPLCSSEVWMADVTLRRGSYYMIEAESGTGKSSLCSYIYGARGDYSGRILFDGRDISTLSVADWCSLRTRAIAYLPQELQLFGELTAMENIEIKNRLTGCKSAEWIMDALTRLEIAHKADVPACRLSVGQQQRVAIVRALCQPFDFMLIDEPVSHLDARNNAIVAELIDSEARARGAAVIATSVGNKILLPINQTLKL